MNIKVQIRSVYGVDTVYPACPKALAFASIAKTKTLTADTLRDIERLGFEIEVEAPRVWRAA
jgi:hypothetical protein